MTDEFTCQGGEHWHRMGKSVSADKAWHGNLPVLVLNIVQQEDGVPFDDIC